MQGGEFSAGLLTNWGTIGGSGQINAPLRNGSSGQILAFPGDHPVFTGGWNVNQGQVQLSGGTVEFTGALTNSPSGQIAGNGSLIVSGGLLNLGSMQFSGVTNVSGPVTNGPGALVDTGGGGSTSFWGNVVNNGAIGSENGSSTVFYGAVSGSGAFAGPGTVTFEGDVSLAQGSSAISLAGSAYFANTSQVSIALAGTTASPQAGPLVVGGSVTLAGGGLNVTLSNGFRPVQNEQFTVLSFGSLNGSFGTESGLDLGGRLQLVPAYTGNSLVLTAVQGGSGAWQSDGDGLVSLSANWSGGLPNAAGDVATFGPVISQPRTVTIDEPTVFGQVVLDSTCGYTLSGSNTLTLDNSGSGATITVLSGQHVINAPVVLADNLVVQSGGGMLDVLTFGNSSSISETGGSRSLTLSGAGGTLILSGTNSYSGGTNVNAGRLVLGSGASLGNTAIVVNANGVFQPAVGTSAGSAISGGGATLNLAGGYFDMASNCAAGTFTLNEPASFSGTSLSLGGGTLAFAVDNSSAPPWSINCWSARARPRSRARTTSTSWRPARAA